MNANAQTVAGMIHGVFEDNMMAGGNVEITATGRVSGNIGTDSLVISKAGFSNGNVIKKNGRDDKASLYLVEDKRTGTR